MGACSLVREEREEREERRGERGCFLCFALPVWSSGWVLVVRLAKRWGFGRGVRPSSVACPCCCSRCCPSGFRPWLRCSVLWLMWGFRFLALLGCWSRQVVLSPFLAVCFFPFVTYNYSIK